MRLFASFWAYLYKDMTPCTRLIHTLSLFSPALRANRVHRAPSRSRRMSVSVTPPA